MITIQIEDKNGKREPIEIPEDISLSLMEILKAAEYPVLATCGGMALCATCKVEVLEGLENLPEANDAELDMLDTLPVLTENTRLACQIRINENINGTIFRFDPEEE